jgi:hypothetical protein
VTGEEFKAGIGRVQHALQGNFDHGFVDYLWKYFGGDEVEFWNRMCDILCRSSKPARNLVFNDFLRIATDLREADAKRRKSKEREAFRGEEKNAPTPMSECIREALKKRNTPFLRRLYAEERKKEGKPIHTDELKQLAREKGAIGTEEEWPETSSKTRPVDFGKENLYGDPEREEDDVKNGK